MNKIKSTDKWINTKCKSPVKFVMQIKRKKTVLPKSTFSSFPVVNCLFKTLPFFALLAVYLIFSNACTLLVYRMQIFACKKINLWIFGFVTRSRFAPNALRITHEWVGAPWLTETQRRDSSYCLPVGIHRHWYIEIHLVELKKIIYISHWAT